MANNGNTLGVNAFAGNNVNIGGAISGGGGLVKYGGQTLTLTGANSYGGPTSIFGGTLALSGNVATINQSSSIVFNNGGALLLTNAVVESGVNRVNAVPINSYGGNIQYNNTTGAGIVYAQNLGAATLYNGEFDVILNNNQSGAGNTQTLTLPGLTQNTTSGAPVITFSAPGTAPNNSTNIIQNTSISSATAANTIIGPWATVGFANNQQSDYAVYNAAGQIVPANIAATTDTSWTTAANSYTFSAGDTLAATRTINSLRYTGGNNSLVLGNFNLQTCGVLYAGSNNQTLTISGGGTGVLTISTGGGDLYLTTGGVSGATGNITVSAPIADNGGAVSVVKSGVASGTSWGSLTLSGSNTFSGGVVLNAGNLVLGSTNALGSGALNISGGALDSSVAYAVTLTSNPITVTPLLANVNNNALTINGDFTFNGSNGMNFGSGAVSLGTTPGIWRNITVSSNNLTLGGVISNGTNAASSVNTLMKSGGGNLTLGGANVYSGGTIITAGTVVMGASPVGSVGNITSSAVGTGPLVFNGGGLAAAGPAAMGVYNPVSFSGISSGNASFGGGVNSGELFFEAPVDLGDCLRTLTANGTVQFDNVLTGIAGSLVKQGAGTLLLNNAGDNYAGSTTVNAGTLRTLVAGALPTNTNVTVASTLALDTATLDLYGASAAIGTLTMGGPTVNGTAAVGTGSSLLSTGAGTLTLGGGERRELQHDHQCLAGDDQRQRGPGDRDRHLHRQPQHGDVRRRPDGARHDRLGQHLGRRRHWAYQGRGGRVAPLRQQQLRRHDNDQRRHALHHRQQRDHRPDDDQRRHADCPQCRRPGRQRQYQRRERDGRPELYLLSHDGLPLGDWRKPDHQRRRHGHRRRNRFHDHEFRNQRGGQCGRHAGRRPEDQRLRSHGDFAGRRPDQLHPHRRRRRQHVERGHRARAQPGLQQHQFHRRHAGRDGHGADGPRQFRHGFEHRPLAGRPDRRTNVWAASNGASQSNWVASYGGASQPLVPGPTTNVVFSNNSGAGVTSPNASTLGADMSVNGITLSDTSNSLVLNADGYTITLGAGGINMPNLPAAINLNQNEVIYPNIVLGAAQTWMNNNLNGNAITFYGNVANGGNLLTVDNSGNSVSIVNAVSGGGGLAKYGAQNLAIQGANSYSGATSVFRGGLTISGASGTIDQTSAITIGNNAGITLTNTSAADSLVNRLGSAPVSVYGGYLQFNNTAAANVNYAQTVGPVTLIAGEFDVTLNNSSNNNGVNSSQVLTLAGLTQNGAAAATFSVPTTEPNATNNVIQVSGATQTAASQIIGPWATVGAATGSQYDYAVYDASGHILPAHIAATAENTWVNGTNVTLSTWPTITSTHALNSLRITADNGTLGLAQFNLQTNGILFADATGNNVKNIGGTSGALMQQGTSPGNLYIAAGQGTGLITISANIQNNTGALTLVKDGSSGSLLLSGLNSFTGGVVSNAGDIEMGATNSVFSTALGTGALVMNGGGIDSNTANMFNLNNNALIINGDFSTTATQSLYFGTGGVTLGTTPGLSRAITVSSTFTLGGVIGNGSYANSLIKAGGGNLVLDGASTYSGTTRLDAGLLEMGVSPVGAVGSITSSAIGSGTLLFNGGGLSSASIAPLTVLNPVGFTGNATIGDPTKLGALTFSGSVDLGEAVRTLTIPGGNVQFNGVVSSPAGGITKTGIGALVLNAAETYGSQTNVSEGTLLVGPNGTLPSGTSVTIGSVVANQSALLNLNGQSTTIGALTMGGPTIFVNNTSTAANATGSALFSTGAGTLTLNGASTAVTYSTTTNVMPATISGNVALGTATDTFTVAHSTELSTASQTAPDLIVSANISGGTGIGLAKAGAGVLLLSGNNTYAGTTTIGAGTLFISGNNTTSGATTISTGTLDHPQRQCPGRRQQHRRRVRGGRPEPDLQRGRQRAVGHRRQPELCRAGTLGATVGSGSNSSAINVAGNATTVASNTITVNIYGNTFSTGTGGSGTYTLVQGGGASSLNNAAYTLGTVYDNTDFTVGSLTKSSTALQAAVTTFTPLATAYWKGGLTGATESLGGFQRRKPEQLDDGRGWKRGDRPGSRREYERHHFQ